MNEKEITNEESIKLIQDFANNVYLKGMNDSLLCVGVGFALGIGLIVVVNVVDDWRQKRKFEREVHNFNKEMES